jgi:hypothetical protein
MSLNKVVFQIGLLAFCISAVIFATERVHLLEAVSRSFIVFVGVVLVSAGVFAAAATMSRKRPAAGDDQQHATPGKETPAPAGVKERKRTS